MHAPTFETAREILQPIPEMITAAGNEIATMARNARESTAFKLGVLASTAVLALGAAKASASEFSTQPAGGGAKIGRIGQTFKNLGMFARGSSSEQADTSGNTVEVDAEEVCRDKALAQPPNFGLRRVVRRNGDASTHIRPYMRLGAVRANGTDCATAAGITRRASIFETKGGKRNTSKLTVIGNNPGRFSRVLPRRSRYHCGETIRGVVVVEADTDGKPGNDPRAVFRTRPGRLNCQ